MYAQRSDRPLLLSRLDRGILNVPRVHLRNRLFAVLTSYLSFVALAIVGAFTPVLAKHSKSFSLIDCISVGVDRIQRSFEPMRKQVEAWQKSELTYVTAKVVIYEAFVEGRLEAPKQLADHTQQHKGVRDQTGCSLRVALSCWW